MLQLSSKNNSIWIENIEKTDFTQLYENVSKVYNFLDEEIENLGDETKAIKKVNQEFKIFTLYKNKYISVLLQQLEIDEKWEKIAILKVHFLWEEAERIASFWLFYFKDYFLEENRIDGGFSMCDFDVLSIKTIIKKRLNLVHQYFAFTKDYILQSDISLQMFDIYRELNIESRKYEKEEIVMKRLWIIMKYLYNELKRTEKIEKMDWYNEDIFSLELKTEQWKIKIISLKYQLKERRWIYIHFFDMEIESAEKIFRKINKIIKKINIILQEERRIKKLLKSFSQDLFMALSFLWNETDFMIKKTTKLIEEYENLIEKWEIYTAPMRLGLLNIILDNLENNHNFYPYLKFGGYKKMLGAIADDNEALILEYLERRILEIYANFPHSSDKQLEQVLSVIYLLNRNFVYIFNKVIEKGYGSEIKIIHIEYILNLLDEGNKIYFLSAFLDDFMIRNPLIIENDEIVGLKLYNQILTYPISNEKREKFEQMIVNVVVRYLEKNPNLIALDLKELLVSLGVNKYVENIDDFISKYSDWIYNQFYSSILEQDAKLVWKETIDFDKYDKLSTNLVNSFIKKVLIADILYKLHTNQSIELVETSEDGLKIRYLLELIEKIWYSDVIYKKVSELGNYELIEYYDRIIGDYNILKDQKIDDYSIEWIKKIIQNDFAKNRQNMTLNISSLSKEDCIRILKNLEFLTEKEQMDLANHRSNKVREELAKRDELKSKVQIKLAKDKKEEVLLAYLGNDKSTKTTKALEIVAGRWFLKASIKLAEREDLEYSVQVELAKSNIEKALIKYLETKKRRQSTEALNIISKKGSEEVCLALLENIEDLPETTQENLANHRSNKVREELAKRVIFI